MRVRLLVEFNGHRQIISLLAKLGVIVAGVAQMDAVKAVGNVQGLRPLVHVLVKFVQQIVPLAVHQQLLGLFGHAQVEGNDGDLRVRVGALCHLLTQQLYALDIAHVAQTVFRHVDAM